MWSGGRFIIISSVMVRPCPAALKIFQSCPPAQGTQTYWNGSPLVTDTCIQVLEGAGGCPRRSYTWSCGGSDHSLESEGSQDPGQYHVCAHHFQCFLWFMEELRVLKRAKKWLENHWGKTNKPVWPQIIKAYLMVLRTVKCKYFSALIASAECCPVTVWSHPIPP